MQTFLLCVNRTNAFLWGGELYCAGLRLQESSSVKVGPKIMSDFLFLGAGCGKWRAAAASSGFELLRTS